MPFAPWLDQNLGYLNRLSDIYGWGDIFVQGGEEMNNVEIRVQNNLVLNGQVVGHRISIGYDLNQRKIRGNYDIGSDHLELILQDFNPT